MEKNKLFVGNISFDANEDEVKAVFNECDGVAEIAIPKDRESGRMRGFAFITFDNDDLASQAKDSLNGKDLKGRELRANFANSLTK
jgi:cold-inducible RNA-binding protein